MSRLTMEALLTGLQVFVSNLLTYFMVSGQDYVSSLSLSQATLMF